MSIKEKYTVKSIAKHLCKEWLLHKHYAKRIPSISYAFGLFNTDLVGICTLGSPPSSSLCVGVCGKHNSHKVLELNRLCVNDNLEKNVLSYFVGRCLKLLKNELIIVSYADTSMSHNGYIYQATNWIYTGLSAKRTDWKIKGKEHLHGITIADEFRGKKNRVELIRKKYGKNFYLKNRPLKHRYIYFTGNKKQVIKLKKELKYKIQPYPKGQNKRYDSSYKPTIQKELF
jgi:hypothetical protein